MKYLQTIAGLRAKSGGTSTCTYDLIKAMRGLSCNVIYWVTTSGG